MSTARVTAADVAREAGVSRSTVSYVLNGSSRHSFPAATVERVTEAARRLRYTPHGAARALRRGSSSVALAVLQSVPQSTALARVVDELTLALAQRGLSLVTWTAAPDTSLASVLGDASPEVIVELMPLGVEDRAAAEGSGVPLVSAMGPLSRVQADIAGLQVSHLAALGHTRLAVVTVDEARVKVFADERRRGAERAASDLGLPVPEVAVLGSPGPATQRELARTLAGWTSRKDPVTAVVCYNDLFAGLTLTAARAAGLTVPGDISVIGVDDEPLAGWLDPPLTTVLLDGTAFARRLISRVDAVLRGDVMDEGEAPGLARLVERASTRPLDCGGA